MAGGHQVFWPAVQQGPADFVVLKDGLFRTVQVKTGTWNRASPPNSYIQCRMRPTSKAQPDRKPSDIADIYAVVSGQDVWVIPASKIDTSNLSLGSDLEKSRPTRWDSYRTAIIPTSH